MKETRKDAAEKAKDAVQDTVKDAADKAKDVGEKAKEAVKDKAVEKKVQVKDKIAPAKDKDASKPEKPEEPVLSPEEQTLKSAKLPTDGPGLVEFFRKRSQLKVDRNKIIELARQLGDKDAAKCDKAYGELISLGTQAAPALRQVANYLDDPEAVPWPNSACRLWTPRPAR